MAVGAIAVDGLSYMAGMSVAGPVMGVMMIIHVIALALFICLPLPAAVVIVINYGITTILPSTYSMYESVGIQVAVAFLVYVMAPRYAAMMVALLVAVALTPILAYHESPYSLLAAYSNCCCAYVLGHVARINQTMVDHYVSDHKRRIADQLHSAATNELSTIVLLTQIIDQTHDPAATKETSAQIESLSRDALNNIHAIIRLLSRDDSSTAAQQQSLGEIARHYDSQLHRLGYQGRTDIDSAILAATSPIAYAALREVYANIVRHGQPNGDYAIAITCEHNMMVIRERNARRQNEPASSGFGLMLLEAQIHEADGTMSTRAHGDRWELTISIPHGVQAGK